MVAVAKRGSVTAREALGLVKQAAVDWVDDQAPRLGAALAYYTVFSIAPLMLVVVGVAGLAFGPEAAQGKVVQELSGLIGRSGAETIQELLVNARKHDSGLLPTVVGLVTLLLGASGVMMELRAALNQVWDVKAPPTSGILGMVRERLASFGMVVAVGFLLLVSLLVSTALAAADTWFRGRLPGSSLVLHALSAVVSLAVVTVLFALVFKFLPDAKVAWRDVWIGAVLTAVLFTVGKTLIGVYLGRSSVASAYGAAGSLVVLLAWVYYAAQIVFFGAELTQVYAARHGSHASGPVAGETKAGPEDRKGTRAHAPEPSPAVERHRPPVPAAGRLTRGAPGGSPAVGWLILAALAAWRARQALRDRPGA